MRRRRAEEDVNALIAFNRRHWGGYTPTDPNAVVLLGLFPVKPSIFCHSHLVNYLARRTGATIGYYNFQGVRNAALSRVYESFGAQPVLDAKFTDEEKKGFARVADEVLAARPTKDELLCWRVGNVRLGDLAYNTYLRRYEQATVYFDDPRLRDIMAETLGMYHATERFFQTRKVTALIADDYNYNDSGIPTRVAANHGVPVYLDFISAKYFVHQPFPEWEDGAAKSPLTFPIPRYREIFAALTPEEQERGLAIGRAYLDSKLSGERDPKTLSNISAYSAPRGRLFPEDGKARIVILMHDFIDAPHGYRWMLFPDFYEWLDFLLKRAANTPFEWYLKPHPATWEVSKRAINRTNLKTLQQFQARFPKVHVLSAETSNRQLVDEGIRAAFTVYGSAGHEFARMGVPVVNAGDNPHAAYTFNIHPRTLEEFAECIDTADRLQVTVNQQDVEEYAYMNYFHYETMGSTGANPLDPAVFEGPEMEKQLMGPHAYRNFVRNFTSDREKKLMTYYEQIFRDLPSNPTPARPATHELAGH